MKTKIVTKPKLRGKAAKIARLTRSAAAKARHHRHRTRKLAHKHLMVTAIMAIVFLGTGTVALAIAGNLIPPPSTPIDAAAYERVAAANRPPEVPPPDQTGIASWYALGLRSPDALTCASTRFARGTYLRVTDLRNGRQVTCLVNDYGPTAATRRVIDLSRGSYSQLEGLGSGTMPVEIRVATGP